MFNQSSSFGRLPRAGSNFNFGACEPLISSLQDSGKLSPRRHLSGQHLRQILLADPRSVRRKLLPSALHLREVSSVRCVLKTQTRSAACMMMDACAEGSSACNCVSHVQAPASAFGAASAAPTYGATAFGVSHVRAGVPCCLHFSSALPVTDTCSDPHSPCHPGPQARLWQHFWRYSSSLWSGRSGAHLATFPSSLLDAHQPPIYPRITGTSSLVPSQC